MPAETAPVSRVDRALTIGGVGRASSGELSPVSKAIYAGQAARGDEWRRSELRLTDPTWTPHDLALYAEALIEQGYATATALLAVRAIRWSHRVHGRPVPDGLPARYVLRVEDDTAPGHAVNGTGPSARLLGADLLPALASATTPGTAKAARDVALVVLVYALGMTAEQLVALDLVDVQPPARTGRVYRVDGAALRHLVRCARGTAICPACSLRGWLDELRLADVTTGPLFRSIDRGGNVGGAHRKGGRTSTDAGRLSPRGAGRELRRLVTVAGLADVVTHPIRDLRLAGALDAYRDGAALADVAARAGYRPDSPLLLRLLLDTPHGRTDTP